MADQNETTATVSLEHALPAGAVEPRPTDEYDPVIAHMNALFDKLVEAIEPKAKQAEEPDIPADVPRFTTEEEDYPWAS